MILFFIKLLLAHLIGDFLLQPTSWVDDKFKRKHKSPYLYWHILIHGVALFVVLGFNVSLWLYILIIMVSHYIIDVVKLHLNNRCNPRWLFFCDQIAHIIVIALVSVLYSNEVTAILKKIPTNSILLFVTMLLFATTVASVCMRVIISKWNIYEGKHAEDKNNSLEKAGAYIGVLERLFVFLFIVTDNWESIGFLIAAKSIFRFGDITEAKNRRLTEYILIGTLLSFAFATIAGIGFNYLKTII